MIWIRFEQFIQDARYAINSLRRAPVFTAVAVLTLALGIGVNAALFMIFDAIVLRPPPVVRPEQLVQLTDVNAPEYQKYFSYLDFLDYRRLSASLNDAVAIWSNQMMLSSQAVQSGDPGDIKLLPIQAVTANYFSFLQAPIVLGRGFLPEDDRMGATSPTIVISDRFWESYFRSAPDVLGKTVPLNGTRYVVVGVASREFVGTDANEPAGWLPIAATPNLQRSVAVRSVVNFQVIGRLKPEVSFQQAEAELTTLAQHLPPLEKGQRVPPRISLSRGLNFISLPSQASNPSAVGLLLVAFVAVLLIAGANVSNLMLARAAARQVEMATRVAIGATRGRLLRQLLTESTLVAIMGGAGALLLARWTLSALSPTLVGSLQLPAGSKEWLLLNLHLDYRVFIFSFAVTLVVGVATGLPAAFQSYREGVTASLRNARGLAFGSWLNPSRLREALVVVQIASCLALLMGAALLLRSLQKVSAVDLGYRPKNVFNVLVTPPRRKDVGDILQRLPGVQSVATAWLTVPTGTPQTTTVKVVGRSDASLLATNYNFVSSNYFVTMGAPLIRGRTFDAREVAAGVPVVVVSESTARRFWPGENPIGQHLAVSTASVTPAAQFAFSALAGTPNTGIVAGDPSGPFTTCEVVGVVRDARNTSLREPDDLYVYLPLAPGAQAWGYFIRVADASLFSESEIRRAGNAAGLRISFAGRSLGDLIEGQLAPFRALAYLGSLLGGLALCLATIGLFGVMSFSVSRRVREMGIRLALGANPGEIIRLVLGQGLRLVACGIALGILVAGALSRLLTHWLVDLTPFDPTALGAVAIVLAGATLLACFLPARRASKIDPMAALRCE